MKIFIKLINISIILILIAYILNDYSQSKKKLKFKKGLVNHVCEKINNVLKNKVENTKGKAIKNETDIITIADKLKIRDIDFYSIKKITASEYRNGLCKDSKNKNIDLDSHIWLIIYKKHERFYSQKIYFNKYGDVLYQYSDHYSFGLLWESNKFDSLIYWWYQNSY